MKKKLILDPGNPIIQSITNFTLNTNNRNGKYSF